MRIKLRFFASLRERLGRSEEIREVSSGATVETVWEMLKRERPELAVLERSLAFAVAQEYVDKTYPLQDNDELAFIPPVSGGSPLPLAPSTRPRARLSHEGEGMYNLQRLLSSVD
jgi:molybdopterin converting factor subunit 1